MNYSIKKRQVWFSILDILATFSWSVLMLKYWFTGQLYLLIHPNYFLLVFASGIILFILSMAKIVQVVLDYKNNSYLEEKDDYQGANLLPKGWASSLLLSVAILGLTIQPMVLNSETALQRGITDSLPPTTLQAESFLNQTPPEGRSLIDWVRTINVYPEPDNHIGQPANITGFVVHINHLPENIIYLSRFVLTCCAVDAYPVGILVELPTPRQEFPPDTWLEVQGVMNTATLPPLERINEDSQRERRYVVLQAEVVKTIPTPRNPYGT